MDNQLLIVGTRLAEMPYGTVISIQEWYEGTNDTDSGAIVEFRLNIVRNWRARGDRTRSRFKLIM